MGLFGNATFGEVFVQEIIIDPLDYENLRIVYDADNKPEKFPSDKELAKAPQNSFIGRATKEKKGGIVSKENFIHISNLVIFQQKKEAKK